MPGTIGSALLGGAGSNLSIALRAFGSFSGLSGLNNFFSMLPRGTAGIAAIGIGLASVYKFLRMGISAGADFEQQMSSSANTLVNRWESVRLSLEGLSATLTGPLRNSMKGSFEGLADMFDSMTSALGGRTGAEMAKMVAARQKSLELAKQEKEAQEQAAKAAKEAHDRLMETMRERGRSLAEALRTPVEVFADTINELDELGRKGFIDPDIFARGIAKAKADLLDATKAAKEFKSATNVSVGAVERFSMAGFSAVQSGRTELIKIIEAEKQQLAESKKHTKLMEDGNELIRKRKPVILTRSNL